MPVAPALLARPTPGRHAWPRPFLPTTIPPSLAPSRSIATYRHRLHAQPATNLAPSPPGLKLEPWTGSETQLAVGSPVSLALALAHPSLPATVDSWMDGGTLCFRAPHTRRPPPRTCGAATAVWRGGASSHPQALSKLKGKLEKGPYGAPDDDTIRWYLRDRYFDVPEAEAKLTSMLRWRREFVWVRGCVEARARACVACCVVGRVGGRGGVQCSGGAVACVVGGVSGLQVSCTTLGGRRSQLGAWS